MSVVPKNEVIRMLDLINRARTEIAGHLIDMDEAILIRILAIVSGVDCFMLSGPGRGKTLLDTLISRIFSLKTGRWQMSKDVVPDFLFGPAAVSSLLKDQIKRNTAGMLPEMDLVTLEEIGNANGPCLDALRMVMSDRVFRNNGGEQPVPLISLTGLSNTWLSGDTIGPVWDRFLLRFELPLPTAEARRAMLQTIICPSVQVTQGLLTRTDIEALHVQRKHLAVSMPHAVIKKADAVFSALEEKGIVSSFRRYKLALSRVVPAFALLEGADEVGETHLMAMQYSLWNDPKDQRAVRKIIAKIADPLADFVTDRIDEVADLKRTVSGFEAMQSKIDRRTEALEVVSVLADNIIPALSEKLALNPNNKPLLKLDAEARALHTQVAERWVMGLSR